MLSVACLLGAIGGVVVGLTDIGVGATYAIAFGFADESGGLRRWVQPVLRRTHAMRPWNPGLAVGSRCRRGRVQRQRSQAARSRGTFARPAWNRQAGTRSAGRRSAGFAKRRSGRALVGGARRRALERTSATRSRERPYQAK